MRKSIFCLIILLFFFSFSVVSTAGTYKLKSGKKLEYSNEAEFVEKMIKEFAPDIKDGPTELVYFLLDCSLIPNKYIMNFLSNPEKFNFKEKRKTYIYYKTKKEAWESEEFEELSYWCEDSSKIFIVEVNVSQNDMVALYNKDDKMLADISGIGGYIGKDKEWKKPAT